MSELKRNSYSAFTLFEVGILVVMIGVIAVLVVNVMPRRLSTGSHHSVANACINNLRQIDAAANQFALEHGKTNGEAISFPNDLTPYIKLNRAGKIPSCPSGGIYSIKKIGETPACSLGTTVTPAHFLP
jgi:type II secretory pathway pseudopilin PulG